eukprot:TRINITY_DN2148_c0_g1_i2.p1 TRINITY_DN2148_c0_g1~~TRINITY_DN2148_c0_g1_i2.p1  ORF type:complete len:372 (-),score=97.22 TRINITY_DN2148_c0_g1_i2:312-1427(-)
MAMVENTFITSLSADQKKARQKQQKREELLDNMESGDQILKLFKDLQCLADDLDERVESKLNANEDAFFLAYKSHMYTVQKEFKELRQRADEEETKTRRDAKIQSLEKELDWFMTEALRLDELCKKYKKELDKWKGRAEALEDDRQFLENQIKTAKRNNKSLRSAVEKAQTSAYAALVENDSAAGADSGAGERTPAAQAITKQDSQSQEPSMLALENSASFVGGLSQELEQRYQMCVKRLQQQLDTERKLAAKLRSVADRQFGEPSELEQHFLNCVEKVRSNISARRRLSRANAERLKKGDVPKAGKGAHHSAPASDKADLVKLDDFTAADRRKVVEFLLSSDQVLQFLYDKLFPPAPDSIAIHSASLDYF